jgi:hypothetical protein
MFIEIPITHEQRARAERWYNFKALPDSITEGESNIYGAIGEIVTLDWLEAQGYDVEYVGSKSFDLLIGRFKVDVKTKKGRNPPRPNWSVSIPATSKRQRCDLYFFVTVNYQKSRAWLLGNKYKEDYFREAVFLKEGEPDPVDPTFLMRCDSYNLQVFNLKPIKPKL